MKKWFRLVSVGLLCVSASCALFAEAKVGSAAPEFSLPAADGATYSLKQFRGKYVVLEWTNDGCPFVKKHYDSGNMQALQKEFTGKDVIWLSICSSAEGKQGYHSAEEWRKIKEEWDSHETAILLDPSGKVGLLYGAKTTPDMFIVDPAGKIIYKGAIDDHSSADSSDIPTSVNYVRQALTQALSGKPVEVAQTKPYGCSVKYAEKSKGKK